MEHSFDTEIAKEYGIGAAVILKHIAFWISKNKADESNFHDGRYWTYSSAKAMNELFPYLSERQIRYAVDKLKAADLIVTGNYNNAGYDRTTWYTLTEKGEELAYGARSQSVHGGAILSNGSDKIVKCNLQNCQMEVTKLSNGSDKIVTPIPDISTDISTDIATDINTAADAANFIPSGTEQENKEAGSVTDTALVDALKAVYAKNSGASKPKRETQTDSKPKGKAKRKIKTDNEYKKFGQYENVVLSESDLEKLKTEFPQDWNERIERLSEYMAAKPPKVPYKNHLAVIRMWARKDGVNPRASPPGTAEQKYSSNPLDFWKDDGDS